MSKLFALFDLFRKGAMVSDPALWKHRQVTATLLIPAIAALLAAGKAFGYDIPVSQEDIGSLAIGLLALVNGVLTYTTTDKIGLPAKPDRDPPSRFPDIQDPTPDTNIMGGRD